MAAIVAYRQDFGRSYWETVAFVVELEFWSIWKRRIQGPEGLVHRICMAGDAEEVDIAVRDLCETMNRLADSATGNERMAYVILSLAGGEPEISGRFPEILGGLGFGSVVRCRSLKIRVLNALSQWITTDRIQWDVMETIGGEGQFFVRNVDMLGPRLTRDRLQCLTCNRPLEEGGVLRG